MKHKQGIVSTLIIIVSLLLLFFLLPEKNIRGQGGTVNYQIAYDTNYYQKYHDKLIGRLYSSLKYAGFSLINNREKTALYYHTNNNYILGAGVTYTIFTLNIGFNFGFINHDDDKYGTSKYLDLQSHIYSRKISLDLYLQWYNGFFIANPDQVTDGWQSGDAYPKRTDIKTYHIGYNLQYIFNSKKFSYRAAYLQNEYQKKSAGSWVIGNGVYYIISQGDSTLNRPGAKNENIFGAEPFARTDMLNIGISGGYFYTFVVARHIFFSLGLSAGPGMGFSWLDIDVDGDSRKTGLTLGLNGIFRSSLGYNSRNVFVGFTILHQIVLNQINNDQIWEYYGTGNIRLTFAYRFTLKKPIRFFNPAYWKKEK